MYVEELKHKSEWEQFLQTCPNATFYHSPQWKQVLEQSFTRPLYLAVRNENGTLVAMCPGFILNSGIGKIYQSTPRSDYAGPIIVDHCLDCAPQSLLKYIQSYCSNNHIAYAKVCLTENLPKMVFRSPAMFSESSGGVVEINLKATPSHHLWNKVFSSSLRKRISRIERNGFQAQEAKTKSDFREFYALYAQNMKYIGASPFSYEFMENAWNLLYPDKLRVWLAGKNKIIAGIAVLKYGQGTYVSYTGIDRKLSHTYSVNPYLVWHEIKKAEEEGCQLVSLGSTSSNPRETHHLQKIELGGLFRKQTTVWYPFNFVGQSLLLCRIKTVNAWKNIRDFLPQSLKRGLEKRLSIF